MANGYDSGDAREAGKISGSTHELDPSHTSTYPMGSISSDRECFQQNISPNQPGSSLGFGVLWSAFNATYNPDVCGSGGTRFYDSYDTNLAPLSPDISTSGGGEVNFYNPSAPNLPLITGDIAQSDSVDFTILSGDGSASPAVDPSSNNYSTRPYNTGSFGTNSSSDIQLDFVRLLPKGTYVFQVDTSAFSPPITGTTVSFYYCTIGTATLITTYSNSGSSAGTNPSITITTPWAWIRVVVNSIQYSGCGFWGVRMAINSYTP